MKLLREYQEAIQNRNASNEEILKLTHDMDVMNAWSLESEARAILVYLNELAEKIAKGK